MDFREALVFLTENFSFTTNTEDLIRIADKLVLSTQPLTLESLAAKIFDPSIHTDRKILFIKDLRAAASEAGLPYGLKECKDAVEEVYLGLLKEKLSVPTQEFDPWQNPLYAHEEEPPF
jgi:ribosomal protein L7/L12